VAGDPRRAVLWPDRPISPPRAREISLCGHGGIAGSERPGRASPTPLDPERDHPFWYGWGERSHPPLWLWSWVSCQR